jgi:hypothetical protein
MTDRQRVKKEKVETLGVARPFRLLVTMGTVAEMTKCFAYEVEANEAAELRCRQAAESDRPCWITIKKLHTTLAVWQWLGTEWRLHGAAAGAAA